jgi:hypothetical protein
MWDFVRYLLGNEDEVEERTCDGLSYNKIKYANSQILKKKLYDDYGFGMI